MQITNEQLKGLEESFAEELLSGGDASMMAATARLFIEELADQNEADLASALATMKQAARVEDNHRDKDFMWIVGQMRGTLEASPLWEVER